jgi:hypothetical protein
MKRIFSHMLSAATLQASHVRKKNIEMLLCWQAASLWQLQPYKKPHA